MPIALVCHLAVHNQRFWESWCHEPYRHLGCHVLHGVQHYLSVGRSSIINPLCHCGIIIWAPHLPIEWFRCYAVEALNTQLQAGV